MLEKPLSKQNKMKQTNKQTNKTQLHYKSLGEIRDTRHISKHSKGNVQQADSQHQIKWRET